MPEIMPSEARNVRPPQQLRPRRLESRLYSKDMLTAARLFAPASEHTHSLLIQSDVTCLATLRVPAFDREELMVEVDGSPAQFEKFTAAKSAGCRKSQRASSLAALRYSKAASFR
jgi:hypothetical protein